MARFHGKVGFLVPTDNQETGIVEDRVVEKTYFGKVDEHSRRWQSSDTVANDLRLGNRIAITANDYAYRYASAICYCEWMGQLWKVEGVLIRRPEIILTLGGVYNGKRPSGSPGCPA